MSDQPKSLAKNLLYGLIVLVFSLAACTMIAFLGRTYYLHAATASWVQVPAQVLDWDLKQNQSRKHRTQTRLVVNYRYDFEGKSYLGDRIDFSIGSDNFSGSRRSRQMTALKSNQLRVFVNPAQPDDSVMDRSLPAQQVAFAVFFLFFPCGLGTAFGLSSVLQLITRLSGLSMDRWVMPSLGLLHGLPALYPLTFAWRELSPGSGLVLVLFGCVGLWSLIEILLRVRNPERGGVKFSELKPVKPLRRTAGR